MQEENPANPLCEIDSVLCTQLWHIIEQLYRKILLQSQLTYVLHCIGQAFKLNQNKYAVTSAKWTFITEYTYFGDSICLKQY